MPPPSVYYGLVVEGSGPVPARINIDTTHTDGARVHHVEGDVDLATAPELEASLDMTIGSDLVVLDLADVGFIDSTGLRTLVAAHEAAETAGAELRIVAGEKLNRLLDLTGLGTRLNVFDSRAAAGVDA